MDMSQFITGFTYIKVYFVFIITVKPGSLAVLDRTRAFIACLRLNHAAKWMLAARQQQTHSDHRQQKEHETEE